MTASQFAPKADNPTQAQDTPRFNQPRRISLANRLGEIARLLGTKLQKTPAGSISDTQRIRGHQFSTLDEAANLGMRTLVKENLPGIDTILEESNISTDLADLDSISYPILVGDAVEGSTNAKRLLASSLNFYGLRPIQAGTALMVLEGPKMGTLIASAFYDWSSKLVITCFRGETGTFIAGINGKTIDPELAQEYPQDTQIYAVVPGYSHSNLQCRCDLEKALLEHNIRSTGGTRSSAQDLLNLLWKDSDAYVDCRSLFPGGSNNCDEVLRAWDVGPLLAALDAVGFIITDQENRSWQDFNFYDQLPLIVTRNSFLWQKIRHAICSLPFIHLLEDEDAVSLPIPHLGGTYHV